MYPLARELHLLLVLLSVSLFTFRGALMIADSPLLATRLLRILPHVIDTFLLGSAIWLVVLLRQYPFVHGWLTAKLLGLVVYIVLGSIALRRGRTRRTQRLALVGAFFAIAYVIGVARHHDALAWFA